MEFHMEQGQAPSAAPVAPVAPAVPAAPAPVEAPKRTIKDLATAYTNTLAAEDAPPVDQSLAVPEPPPAPEGEAPPPPEETAQPEVPETSPDAPETTVEIDIEGKIYRVPEEIKDGYLRQADYTRKTQEVAQNRRQVEAMLQAANQAVVAAQQFGDVFGQIKQADAAIESFHRLDWNALRESDPVDYATKQADYTRWQMHRQSLVQNLQLAQQQVTQAQAVKVRADLEKALPVLQERIPGWGPSKQKEIRSHASYYGYSDEELDGLTDPRAVLALHDAMEYRKLTAKRVEANKKLATLPPVAKPSARPAQSEERIAYQKTREKFREGGGRDLEQLAGLLKHRLKG